MNLRNLKLKPRLCLTFGMMALVFGAAIGLGLWKLAAFNRAVQSLTGSTVPQLEQNDAWALEVMDTVRRTRSMAIRDANGVKEEIDGARSALGNRKSLADAAAAAARTPEEKAALKPVLDAESVAAPLEEQYLQLFEAGRKQDAMALMDAKMRPAEHALLDVFADYRGFQNSAVLAQGDALGVSYRRSMQLLLLLSGGALVIGTLLALWTAQSLSKPMRRVIGHFEAFARGDFTDKIVVDSRDEIGQVLAALEQTQASLGRSAEAAAEYQARNAAISKSLGSIEYSLDGNIITANEIYLRLLGYTMEELRGKHIDMLLDAAQRSSGGAQGNLEKLRRGEHIAALQKRIAKGGRELWVQASVNPIPDASGKPCRAITYVWDVTEQVSSAAEFKGQIAAVNRAQAVIEFKLDGTIITANENFLETVGYTLEEIRGQRHSMFVDPAYAAGDEYRRFWERLGRGEYDAGQYKRLAKGGREVWIQASYNPILNAEGKPYKVVKFATDITAQRQEAEMNAAFKGALDNLLSNVMVANNDLNVMYLNSTVKAMLAEAQADIRRDLPQFDAARLLGASINSLQKNPGQGGLLRDLDKSFTSEVLLGGRTFRIVANPMRNAEGKRIGTVVEWADRTQELKVEAEVAQIVSRALENDLSLRVDMSGKTAFFANLGGGLNKLLDNMAQMVRDIKASAAAVRIGADEISKGNTNLSQRTEEQSSSLEETASSMEEMTSTVKQNADNAGQANQLATAARDQAEKGGAVVGKAVRAMADINDSSKKIADIISVIDEIAFQTNLLALNAAVEAARAGEQGRGFAVVATEVRSLAGRSATAAKEIKSLIKDSVRKVEDGSALVTQSGQTLEQIVSSVKKVSDIIAEIAAASREQSSGIEQVNKAVMQMDEMTQQNAALVEEATAASQAMAEGAGELNRMMERFTLPGATASGAAGAPATPVAAVTPSGDRRGTARPWNGKSKDAVERPPAKAAAGGDWQDF